MDRISIAQLTERLNKQSFKSNSSNSKWHEKLKKIVEALGRKELTAQQIEIIEKKNSSLFADFSYLATKKGPKQIYHKYESFLKSTFSFVPEGYYTAMGISLGLSFGAGLGTVFGTLLHNILKWENGIAVGVAIGPGIGMTFGLAYGKMKEQQAQKEGRILK